jgi:hypothetical protein
VSGAGLRVSHWSLYGVLEDKMAWSLSKSQKFEVKSYYYMFRGGLGTSFPWNIWPVKVPYAEGIAWLEKKHLL